MKKEEEIWNWWAAYLFDWRIRCFYDIFRHHFNSLLVFLLLFRGYAVTVWTILARYNFIITRHIKMPLLCAYRSGCLPIYLCKFSQKKNNDNDGFWSSAWLGFFANIFFLSPYRVFFFRFSFHLSEIRISLYVAYVSVWSVCCLPTPLPQNLADCRDVVNIVTPLGIFGERDSTKNGNEVCLTKFLCANVST